MTARPTEIKALVPLLEQDWESPEALAKSLIDTLDKARADRTSYVSVLEIGRTTVFFTGSGPYPTQNKAQKALTADLTAFQSLGVRGAVVPILSPQGRAERLALLDAIPGPGKLNKLQEKDLLARMRQCTWGERTHVRPVDKTGVKVLAKHWSELESSRIVDA